VTDGVVDVVGPLVLLEPYGRSAPQACWHEAPLVQQVTLHIEGVWGLIGVISVAVVLYEGMLIWVPVF